jgi:hypothetical protein
MESERKEVQEYYSKGEGMRCREEEEEEEGRRRGNVWVIANFGNGNSLLI